MNGKDRVELGILSASETSEARPLELTTIWEDVLCPNCGYSLRGLAEHRCPECGQPFDPGQLSTSCLPWVHRRRIGRLRAYWQTVWLVMFHNARFRQEFARPVSYADAQRFRAMTVLHFYVPWEDGDSDLSVTSWQLLFLRSARNAGFEVPAGAIDDAVLYVQRCFDYRLDKTFHYGLIGQDRRATRAMAGAGILAFSMGGLHGRPEAHAAGDWILAHPFDSYNGPPLAAALPEGGIRDRFHYGVFYCTQAMFQLGGTYWERFFPVAVDTLLANQSPEGCWAPESAEHDAEFGNAYTTALVVLTLTTPDQLLPICQR